MRKYLVFLLCVITFPSAAATLKLDSTYQVFEGSPVSLQSYIGKQPMYLKLWASWCGECRQELPSLQKAYERYHDRIAMFAINLNINETEDNIRKLYRQHGMTIPTVLDNNGSIASNFTFKGTPFHVLINRGGEVVYTTYRDDDALAEKLELLATGKLDSAEEHGKSAGINQLQATSSLQAAADGIELMYFSATWCDWYYADIHPDMADNCLNAIRAVGRIHQEYPDIKLQAYVTHLWTEAKDVAEYRQKFSITYPVTLDQNNARLQQYQANSFPTLVVLRGGKEVARFTHFKEPEATLRQLRRLL